MPPLLHPQFDPQPKGLAGHHGIYIGQKIGLHWVIIGIELPAEH